MPVIVDRETLALDLRSYGEDELAHRVAAIDDQDLADIGERADDYLYGEANGLIPKAVTLAAIEVLEGTGRPPRFKRRKLKGIYPEELPRAGSEFVDRGEVERAIGEALVKVGYQRASDDRTAFLKPLTEDVTGRVGYFIQRLETGGIDVTPTVGVRHERIHELTDRIRGRSGSRTEPTATIILGYLMPQASANVMWQFDGETPIDQQAGSLAEHVVRYGEPWMRERIPQDAIIETIRADERGSAPVHPERLSVALWLAGRPDDAREALDAELEKAAGRHDAAAENFRQFAERFRGELLASASRPR